jgi:hypothetical protein
MGQSRCVSTFRPFTRRNRRPVQSHLVASTKYPINPNTADNDTYEPASARALDRRATHESDDSADFYRPEDSRVGSAPGIDESSSRGANRNLRTLVTGTTAATRANDARGGKGKKGRFAAMEQERHASGSYGEYDRLDREDERGPGVINPDTLEHQF